MKKRILLHAIAWLTFSFLIIIWLLCHGCNSSAPVVHDKVDVLITWHNGDTSYYKNVRIKEMNDHIIISFRKDGELGFYASVPITLEEMKKYEIKKFSEK